MTTHTIKLSDLVNLTAQLENVDMQDLKNSQQVFDDMNDALKKAESLRSELEITRRMLDIAIEQGVQDSASRKEWKRRATEMWTWMHRSWVQHLKFSKVSDDYRNDNPEAAEWFEDRQ